MESIQKTILIYLAASYLIFAAACLHLVSTLSLVIIAGISLALILPLRRLELDAPVLSPVPVSQKKGLVFCLGGLFLLLVHVILLPPYARDDVIYHLLVPKRLLADGGFRFDPFNINSNFPMVFELPLTLFLLFKGWVSPLLLNYGILLVFCIAYYLTARRVFKINHPLSTAAAILLATTPVVYDQLRSCYVELFMCLLVLLTFYNYFHFRSRRHQPHYWYLTMLFAGGLCATKYTGVVFALFIVGVEFFSGRDRRLYYQGLLICAAVSLPWYLKNWIMLGNPVFPLMAFLFPSEYLTIERSIFFKHLFADYHGGRTPVDYLLLPFKLLAGYDPPMEAGRLGFGGQLSFFFIFAYASMAALLRKPQTVDAVGNRRLVGWLFVGYALFWAVTSQQVRFFLPVLALASLSGLSYLSAHWNRWKPLFFLMAGLVLVQNGINIGSTVKQEQIGSLLSGSMNREQFLNYHMPISYKMAKKLDRILDSDRHRLLAVGNFGRNFYYDVEVVTNTYYEAEILSQAFHTKGVRPKVLEDFVDAHGITHLLINHAYLKRFFSSNAEFAMDALSHYLSGLTPVLTQKSVVVYALKK